MGYFNQDGLLNTFDTDYSYNFGYKRYNYRANIDMDMTKSTKFSLTIGGTSGLTQSPSGGPVPAGRHSGGQIRSPDSSTRGNVYWLVPATSALQKKRMDLNAIGYGTGIFQSIIQRHEPGPWRDTKTGFFNKRT